MNGYGRGLLALVIAPVVLAAASAGWAGTDFDGVSGQKDQDLFSRVKAVPAPGAVPARAVAQAQGAGEDWRTEVLSGAAISLNRKFRALEAEGHDLRVEKCQFGRFSPDTILIGKRKLASGARTETRTEYLLGAQFKRRMSELEGRGIAVAIKCYENIPWHFGDHGLIQYGIKDP